MAAAGLGHIGRGDVVFVTARIVLLGAMVLPCISFLGALEILQTEVPLRFRPLEFSPGAFRLGLVRPRIDHKQQIARFHLLPILEMDGIKITADPRAHLDGLDRLKSAGEIIPFGDFL